ncbi:hypothetical protein [Pseudoalteromonas denitrificans]|uniref:Uncharacterized protein n=1 Tax=Pseudoalteromonas denitrificans DSM 6059 TaxID=1123010 RepID=A0A1I1GD27_9GAMM|nr:hypothetical protein [Pseudoalteromonas denitrificans]SFC07233.1 hypothetical protein SAMN02745724_00836 [Pseudoalteromonas denitrificans DSM 6059]
MADYNKAFNHLTTKEITTVSNSYATEVKIDSLKCWQSLSLHGFSEKELFYLFKNLYCVEIWQQIRADQIDDQITAQLLFKAALEGHLNVLIKELQTQFELPATGVMCSFTLNLINHIDNNDFKDWLSWGLVYQETIDAKNDKLLPQFRTQTGLTHSILNKEGLCGYKH